MGTKINKSHLMLMKIIEKSGNKNCADCGIEGTRWASWNFGIFLCIRCAGIHRKLGVHISKVKSVDLDSWTTEQLQMMESIGNNKSQKIYEASLPDNFMRPQSNYGIEEFIRAKYQHKRYCLNGSDTLTMEHVTEAITTTTATGSGGQTAVGTRSTSAAEPFDRQDPGPEESDDSLSDPDYLMKINDEKEKRNRNGKAPDESIGKNLIDFESKSAIDVKNDFVVKEDSESQKKNRILSLYTNHQAMTPTPMTTVTNDIRYQSSFHPGQGAHFTNHKSYGSSSSSFSAYSSTSGFGSHSFFSPSSSATTSIPLSNQNHYLEKIQDKLKVLKDNLTSRFKPNQQYEQPGKLSSSLSSQSFSSSLNCSPLSISSAYQPTAPAHVTPFQANSGYKFHSSNSSMRHNQSGDNGLTLSPDLWR